MNRGLKKFIAIMIILIVVSFIILIVRQPSVSTPSLPPNLPTPTPIHSRFGNLITNDFIFTGEEPDIPPYLSVYSVQSPTIEAYVDQLAQNFKLEPHPEATTLWQNQGKTESLTLMEQSGTVIYNNYNTPQSSAGGISTEQSLKAARYFLDQIGSNYYIDESKSSYIDNQNHPNSTLPQTASNAVHRYTFTINDYPLITDTQTISELQVWVNNANQVFKATITTPPTQTQEIGQLPTISFAEAMAQIQSGQASIINLKNPANPTPLSSSDLSKINLTSAQLEYRNTPGASEAYPYLNFKGSATHKNEQIAIEIIVPVTPLSNST